MTSLFRLPTSFFLLFIASIFHLPSSVYAVEPSSITVHGIVDRETATIGDIVNYTVTFAYPKTFKLEIPEKTDTLGQWTLKEIQQTQKEEKGNIIQDVNFALTAYTTGTLVIPEITFNISDDKNTQKQIKTQPVNITIESVMARFGQAGDIRDIKPPLGIRTPLWLIILRLLLAAAAVYGAYYWYNRFKKKQNAHKPPEPEVPAAPPVQTALEALEKLRNSGLIAEGRIKEFYIALTDIIRNYISAEFSIDTIDKTTSEIISGLRNNKIDKKLVFDIKDFFDECDLVKFAKYRPDGKICLRDLDNAVNIVKPLI